MIDWLFNLPVAWTTLAAVGGTYLCAGVTYWVVTALAVGERARGSKGSRPVCCRHWASSSAWWQPLWRSRSWGDVERAKTAVNREVSALRAVISPHRQLSG